MAYMACKWGLLTTYKVCICALHCKVICLHIFCCFIFHNYLVWIKLELKILSWIEYQKSLQFLKW